MQWIVVHSTFCHKSEVWPPEPQTSAAIPMNEKKTLYAWVPYNIFSATV
jgi:hypothetical protein